MAPLLTMSPWDTIGYFRVPRETLFATMAAGDVLCGYDPMRVVLMMGSPNTNNPFSISMVKPGMMTQTGIMISADNQPIILTHALHGPLVQQQWFVGNSIFNPVTVIEVFLDRWPSVDDEPSY